MSYHILTQVSFRERSPRSGHPTYHLVWIDYDTLETLVTDVDTTMRNYLLKGWRQVLQQPEPLGLYTNLEVTRRTSNGLRVITADSRPVQAGVLTPDEIQAWVASRFDYRKPTQFDSLHEELMRNGSI